MKGRIRPIPHAFDVSVFQRIDMNIINMVLVISFITYPVFPKMPLPNATLTRRLAHGGAAFGFDRIVALLTGETSIKEFIAFPKTTNAMSLMDGSPSGVDEKQLKELGIKIDR